MVKGFVNTQQASEILGINRARVIALIHAGRLPAEKISGIWLIKESDLEKVKDRKPGRPPKHTEQEE